MSGQGVPRGCGLKAYLAAFVLFVLPTLGVLQLASWGADRVRLDRSEETGGLSAIYWGCTGEDCP